MSGFLLGFLGRVGKFRVGDEEGGEDASHSCMAPRGGLGVLPLTF